MKSVLLVEIIVSEQFSRAVAFPFIKGYLKSKGVVVLWLRFACHHAVRAKPGQSGISLLAKDLDVLRRHLTTDPPTHVLVSHEPAPDLVAVISGALPQVQVGWICDQVGHTPKEDENRISRVFPDVPSVAGFFGLSPDGDEENLFEVATPDFFFEAANPEASSAPPLPYLVCGPDCTYRRSLKSNPFFAGVDLAGCDERGGCTFCVRPARDISWTKPPEEVMARQLDAIARAWRGATDRLLVRAMGETFLKHVNTFAGLVTSRTLPPCDFLLDGRADLLLARESHMEEALRLLQKTPHRLHVSLVGVENFSDTELSRMNKGTSCLKNLDLARLLFRLEREFPNTFEFRRWGGLSLILLTPWTRPQDLAFNFSVLNICRLEEFAGKVFSGRLRLYPSLPLHRLAERDGLLLSAYDDPALETTRSNPYASLYPDETPWRFQDPRMELVGRVLARMATPPDRLDEADRAMFYANPPLGQRPHGVGFALGLLDVVIASDLSVDMAWLVTQAGRLRSEYGREWVLDAESLPGMPLDPRLSVQLAMMAVRVGVKPVARLEGDATRHIPTEGSDLVSATHVIGGEKVVFVARDAALIAQAATAARYQREEDDPRRREEALLTEGHLLGYPTCCVRAFAAREGPIRDNYTWLHILRRTEHPGEVSPLFHPGLLAFVEHIPCSLSCAESLKRAERLFSAWREEKGAQAALDLMQSLERPWLLLTEAEGQRVELVPLTEPGERFHYRPGLWSGDHPLIRTVLQGDEIVVDDTGISIMRSGRLWGALGCRAFLWWHRRAFRADLWQRVIALRFEPRLEPGAGEALREPPDDPAVVEKARRLAAFVASALIRDKNEFEGFHVASIEPGPGQNVRLSLRSQSDRFTLVVVPTRPGLSAFERIGVLSLLHPDGEPLDTPAKVRAARRVASRLKAALARRPQRQ